MIRLFIETNNKHASEYLFFKYLLFEEFQQKEENFEIVCFGGKDNWDKNENKFEEEGKNIVIFDADGKNNGGGYEKRKKEIEEKREELNLEFDLFLMPNNKDDGCFETILENCVKDRQPLDCFECFEDCINKHNEEGKYNLPNLKSKIYSYIDTVNKGSKKDKKEYIWQFENKDYWDFECDYIKPLKDFLQKEIQ